jgi:hypothetical protein
MTTIISALAATVAALLLATGALHALLFALRPVLVRLMPDDLCGPDGMYIDTAHGRGILDFDWARGSRRI